MAHEAEITVIRNIVVLDEQHSVARGLYRQFLASVSAPERTLLNEDGETVRVHAAALATTTSNNTILSQLTVGIWSN